MTTVEEAAMVRKEKLIVWLKNPYNFTFLVILVLAFALRAYNFFTTPSQPLWWDEAEYMGIAKHLAFGAPFDVSPFRPPLFMFLSAFFLKLGLGEGAIRFFFVVIPSTAVVAVTYFLGREMFNKKVGIAAEFLMAFSWTILFWSARVQPDFLSLFFQEAAVLFMWKYWKEPKRKNILLAGLFAGLGFQFKVSGLLVPFVFAVFILIKDRIAALKNRDYYIFALVFIATLVPQMIWGYVSFNNPLPFLGDYSSEVGTSNPYGWYNIGFFRTLTDENIPGDAIPDKLLDARHILFWLFILGVVYSLRFLLYIDVMVTDKKRCFNPELFSLLALALISAFYIFWIKGTEDRWVFLWLPFIFFIISEPLVALQKYLTKYHKMAGIILIIVLIGLGGYYQYKHGTSLVKERFGSYGPVKESSIWIKENSQPEDKVITFSTTQAGYYSERKLINLGHIGNVSHLQEIALKEHPKYLVFSIFEPVATQPRLEWFRNYIQTNQTLLTPAQAYYQDAERKQPVLIVYKINN